MFNGDIVGGVPGSVFDVEYVRPLLEDGIPYLGFERTQEDQVYFEEFDKAYSACVTEKPGYEFQVRDSLSKILLHVIEKGRINATHNITGTQEIRFKKMLVWIDGHISDKISVSDVAESAGVCVRECQRPIQPVYPLQPCRIYNVGYERL